MYIHALMGYPVILYHLKRKFIRFKRHGNLQTLPGKIPVNIRFVNIIDKEIS
ncbi:MAG: hypothetical protein K0R18_794 [Bacillales bacterium]|jgi:hypothetical protein|nr:hypothetical protein [Bacillales bacterium]